MVFIVALVAILSIVFMIISVDLSPDSVGFAFIDAKTSSCPPGTQVCSTGDSVACCGEGYSCKTSRGNAWCSPNDQSVCPEGTTWCGSGSGGGRKDATCCTSDQTCTSSWGYSWCQHSQNACESQPGHHMCGYYCCGPHQTCENLGLGFSACSAQSCPSGQTLCSGKDANICCNSGTCNPSTSGAAHCSDGQYNPVPQDSIELLEYKEDELN